MTGPDLVLLRSLAGTDDVEVVNDRLDVVVVGYDRRDSLTPRSIVRSASNISWRQRRTPAIRGL
jgi:hypothetical protein